MIRLKRSIQLKSILLFTTILTFMTFFLLIANITFLQKYYVNKSMKKLNKISTKIVSDYQYLKLFDDQYISQLEENYNIRVSVVDFQNSTLKEKIEKNKNKFNPTISFLKSLSSKDIDSLYSGNKIVHIIKHNRFRGHFIALAYKIPDEHRLIVLSAPIAQIKEAAQAASEFLLIASIITLFLGSIAVYFSAKKISSPIIKINSVAKSLSQFNFKEKINIKTYDELQELGESINFLSSELETKITDLNSLNKKLVAEIEKEREIEKMRRVFISNISHELKTPIAVIGGYAEALYDNILTSEENRIFYSSTIIKESAKMSKIVNELLLISKLESSSYSLKMDFFDLSSSTENVLKKFFLHIDKKEINIIKNYSMSFSAYGNNEQVESCIENFLTNALSYVNYNGDIAISIFLQNNSVFFEIYNSGEQIPTDKTSDIWLAFYRADESRSKDLGGTGLGLSIVKSIIDKHNGGYGCENCAKGVKFWFSLPQKV
jgi:two-component system, OmpR family, sensor histidine kinase VanS